MNTTAAIDRSRPPRTNSRFCNVRVDVSGPSVAGGSGPRLPGHADAVGFGAAATRVAAGLRRRPGRSAVVQPVAGGGGAGGAGRARPRSRSTRVVLRPGDQHPGSRRRAWRVPPRPGQRPASYRHSRAITPGAPECAWPNSSPARPCPASGPVRGRGRSGLAVTASHRGSRRWPAGSSTDSPDRSGSPFDEVDPDSAVVSMPSGDRDLECRAFEPAGSMPSTVARVPRWTGQRAEQGKRSTLITSIGVRADG